MRTRPKWLRNEVVLPEMRLISWFLLPWNAYEFLCTVLFFRVSDICLPCCSFPEKVGNRMERKRSIKESDWHLRKRRESNVSKKPKKAPRSTHVKSPKRKNATNLWGRHQWGNQSWTVLETFCRLWGRTKRTDRAGQGMAGHTGQIQRPPQAEDWTGLKLHRRS